MQEKKLRQGKFFDDNIIYYGHANGSSNVYDYDHYILDLLKNNNEKTNLLDIGCGIGTFAKLAISKYPNMEVTVVDPSNDMLNKITDIRIKKQIGSLPKELHLDNTFDYIHVKEVFHHITGNSIEDTRDLLKESLKNIHGLLDDNGVLFVHEIYYESPIISSISSRIIYYLCKVQNRLKVKIPIKEFIPGLDVYFYNRDELRNILNVSGYRIIAENQLKWNDNIKKKLLFLNDWGRIILVCKKL